MRMIICIVLCLTLSLQGEAQNFKLILGDFGKNNTKVPVTQNFQMYVKNIEDFNTRVPMELAYLDHDRKEGCEIGDTIHFSVHVVNAVSLTPTDKSGIVYVDLVDPKQVVVDRRKLSLDSLGMARGCVVVDTLLNSGFYMLRAYTRYQGNWCKFGDFRSASSVIPVYYPESMISEKERKKNKGAGFIDLSNSILSQKLKEKDFRVFFYYESSGVSPNVPTRFGVHATDKYGNPMQAKVSLYDYDNEVVSKCELDRFGNGVLDITPIRMQSMKIVVKGKEGKRTYMVPRVKSTGVSMMVNSINVDSVDVTINRYHENRDSDMCVIVLNRGNLLFCDSLKVRSSSHVRVPKSVLRRGVHEVVAFAKNGKQLASRRFFHGKINSDEEQWLLLDSELNLRNVLPKGAYKTLTDEEIDRILIVDKTRSCYWYEMASLSTVTQPMEKSLMVYGKVVPMALRPNAQDLNLDGRKFTLTLNQGKEIYKSEIICDKNGSFGSFFPNLKGEWMLMAHHSDELTRHKVLLYDVFPDALRKANYLETVPSLYGKTKWVSPKEKRYKHLFYNCDTYTNERLMRGDISQNFYGWLGQKNRSLKKMKGAVSPVVVNVNPDSAFNKHIDYNFFGTSSDDPRTVAVDGPTYNGRPIVWIIDGQYRMVTGLNKMITDFSVSRPCERHMPNFVDEVKNVFITEDPTAFYPYMRCSVLESKKPVTVFITLHKNYIWNDSGLVTAPFQGVE